jgi:hypothetical protein
MICDVNIYTNIEIVKEFENRIVLKYVTLLSLLVSATRKVCSRYCKYDSYC